MELKIILKFSKMNTFKSDLTGKEFPISEKISGKTVRKALINLIIKDNPNFRPDQFLSIEELNYYREKYISEYLNKQVGELDELDKTVLSSLTNKTTLSDKIDDEEEQKLTIGQKLADNVASFGGSWTFIISFAIFIIIWIIINTVLLSKKSFDPYPFILLNLMLSCLAALQAPVIMMSQNRQESKDRDRSKKDYMINLKAEVEVRTLHEKMDHLIMFQQQEVIEIQKVQIELMKQILDGVNKNLK